jgi:hypothetical protein
MRLSNHRLRPSRSGGIAAPETPSVGRLDANQSIYRRKPRSYTLLLSVFLYIIIPVIIAQVWRHSVMSTGGQAALAKALKAIGPISLVALLTTLVLLPPTIPNAIPLAVYSLREGLPAEILR